MAQITKKKTVLKSREDRFKELFHQSSSSILKQIINADSPTDDIDISIQYDHSTITLGEYTTLDYVHRSDIRLLMKTIIDYSNDSSKKRPLNIIMQAEPGSGKSHFIKCLAERLYNYDVSAVTFNMSSLQNLEDFIQPLEAVRNQKVLDQLPILFLDEFDSDETNYPLLLPLLWDGEMHVGQRDLKLGKVVIILAGSSTQIEKAVKSAKGMIKDVDQERTKIIDLLSRINGGEFNIPDLDYKDENRDRRVDKICISISILINRFGKALENVPWALLKFISLSKFRYGVRSLTHFIDMIPAIDDETKELQVKDLRLPLKSVPELKSSSLAYHLVADDGPAAIVTLWKELSSHTNLVKVYEEKLDLPF